MQLPLPFDVKTTRIYGGVVVSVSGELDVASAPRLRAVLAEETAKGRTVVLDTSDVQFIDSTGIQVLLTAWQQSKRDGCNLRLTRGSACVMSALQLVDVIDELPFIGRSTTRASHHEEQRAS